MKIGAHKFEAIAEMREGEKDGWVTYEPGAIHCYIDGKEVSRVVFERVLELARADSVNHQ